MSEALLEVTNHYNRVSYEENLCLQKELETVKAEVWKACHYRNKPVGVRSHGEGRRGSIGASKRAIGNQ